MTERMSNATVIARLMRANSYAHPMIHEEDMGTDVERFFDMRRQLYGRYRHRGFDVAAYRADHETISAILARSVCDATGEGR